MDVQILPMRKDHLFQVAELEKECFSVPWSFMALEESFTSPHARFWVAEEVPTGNVLGYASFNEVVGEGYVNNVAVFPLFQRKGIASKLVDAMWHYAEKNLEFLSLEVRISNRPALALYEKKAFTRIALRKNYYDHPTEDAVIMTRYKET